MREYTLNDIRFNPEPLTLFETNQEYRPNEDELEQRFKMNRKIIQDMKLELEKILKNV